jgi:hypothetical protein
LLPGKRTFSDSDVEQVLGESLDVYAKVCDKYPDLSDNERMILLQTAINMVGKRDVGAAGILGLPGGNALQ